MVDLTGDVIAIEDEDGEYPEIDICSVSREAGTRAYWRRVHANYLEGGVTLC